MVAVQHVTAVVTTGIYCRPGGCSATPRRENTRRLPSPAAAEAAGFRACLRCRPYRHPAVAPTTGPELVCRAVRMVLSGALDEGTEQQLAARVGVSSRHLRRLFTIHVGVTPSGLARSARAHFARRLLDDTDLSITDIAYAAGFGSLRQFNRVCVEIFRTTPKELRARRRVADRLAADGGLPLRLPFYGPLDWPALLAYLRARAVPGVEHVDGLVYRRTVQIDGHPGVVELLPGGDDHLVLRAHLPRWDGLIHVVQRVRRIAGLDLDLSEPVSRLSDEEIIGPLVHARPGLRPPGTWDAFETGVRALVGHRRSHGVTNMQMATLVQRFGQPVPGLAEFGLHYLFPSPQRLAAAGLAEIGGPPSRAAAVRGYARAVAADEVRLDRSVGLGRLVSRLVALDGMGQQTAHYIALRLGEADAWPVTARMLSRTLAAGGVDRWSPQLVERWRPWRAVAAVHLWAWAGARRSV